jgi:dephospho-CoA kinase
MLIGLTGNIGSGKSAVAGHLLELGAHVIDADKVVHELYVPTSPLPKRLAAHFGKEILAQDASVDRKVLSTIVLSDPSQMQRLNEIVHPLVKQRIQEKISTLKTDKPVVVEAALLFEAQWQDMFDAIILVVASHRQRKKRLLRRGMSPDTVQSVFALQTPALQKVPHTHYVIDNDGDIQELRQQVEIVWQELNV